MVAKVIPLDKASALIGQVAALDAKRQVTITTIETLQSQVAHNKEEIKRRIKLEHENEELEKKIAALIKEETDMKHDRDFKVTELTQAGWVVPAASNPVIRGVVSM